MRVVFFILHLISSVTSYNVWITVKNVTAEECPTPYNRRGTIDRDSIKVDIRPAYQVLNADALRILDEKSKLHTITFPGCYDVRVQMRVLQPMRNPYTESFMQMGTHLPCKQENTRVSSQTHYKVCTNITRDNWCPNSINRIVRDLTVGKETCHFCNVCESAQSESKKSHKFLQVLTGDLTGNCDFYNPYEPYTMRMRICTPSRDEINKADRENDGKVREYWEYLKHGSLTLVNHLLERNQLSQQEKANCERLCSIYSQQQQLSASYAKTLEQQLTQMCTPSDNYVSCVYSTIRFDVRSTD